MEDVVAYQLGDILKTSRNFTGRITLNRSDDTYFATCWYINGVAVMTKSLRGSLRYLVPRAKGDTEIKYFNSFEELFDTLSDQHKEMVIWNLDLWK